MSSSYSKTSKGRDSRQPFVRNLVEGDSPQQSENVFLVILT